jgi:hypothetical protein
VGERGILSDSKGNRMENSKYWPLESEIEYIDKVAAGEISRRVPAEQLLENYIVRAKDRIRNGTFGSIDGEHVLAYAKAKLQELQEAAKKQPSREEILERIEKRHALRHRQA